MTEIQEKIDKKLVTETPEEIQENKNTTISTNVTNGTQEAPPMAEKLFVEE